MHKTLMDDLDSIAVGAQGEVATRTKSKNIVFMRKSRVCDFQTEKAKKEKENKEKAKKEKAEKEKEQEMKEKEEKAKKEKAEKEKEQERKEKEEKARMKKEEKALKEKAKKEKAEHERKEREEKANMKKEEKAMKVKAKKEKVDKEKEQERKEKEEKANMKKEKKVMKEKAKKEKAEKKKEQERKEKEEKVKMKKEEKAMKEKAKKEKEEEFERKSDCAKPEMEKEQERKEKEEKANMKKEKKAMKEKAKKEKAENAKEQERKEKEEKLMKEKTKKEKAEKEKEQERKEREEEAKMKKEDMAMKAKAKKEKVDKEKEQERKEKEEKAKMKKEEKAMKEKSKKETEMEFTAELYKHKIKTNINGQLVSCMIDTGAYMSCVTKDFLKQIGSMETFNSCIPHRVRGSCGEIMVIDILGETVLEVDIGGLKLNHTFRVVKTSPFKLLIGRDFLMKHHVKVDFQSMRVTVPDPQTILEKEDKFERKCYCAKPKMEFTEKLHKCHINTEINGQWVSAIVDTGASRSWITIPLLEQVGSMETVYSVYRHHISASGRVKYCSGETILEVNIGGFKRKQKFAVHDAEITELGIGINFLMKHHVKIDYHSKTITIPNPRWNIFQKKEGRRQRKGKVGNRRHK